MVAGGKEIHQRGTGWLGDDNNAADRAVQQLYVLCRPQIRVFNAKC